MQPGDPSKNTVDEIPTTPFFSTEVRMIYIEEGTQGKSMCLSPWIVTGLTPITPTLKLHRPRCYTVILPWSNFGRVNGSDLLLIYALHSQIKNDRANVVNEDMIVKH